MHKAHFVHISVTLADSLSNCPVVQLLIVNIRSIGPFSNIGIFQCLFRVFRFPQVVQKHTLGEVGT